MIYRIAIPVLFVFVLTVSGQDSEATRPVGFLKVDCPEGSDTWVSSPFEHVEIEASVPLRSRPRNTTSRGIVTFSLAIRQPWSKNQYVDSHYVRIGGDHYMAGRAYEIYSMSSTTLGIYYRDHFPQNDFEKGDIIEVVPYPTLDDLLPPGEINGFTVSDGLLPAQRNSELLVFSETASSETPTPTAGFFLTSDGWQKVTNEGVVPGGSEKIAPWQALVIRNRTGAGSSQFIVSGKLNKLPSWAPLPGEWNTYQIAPATLPNVEPVRLADLNLGDETYMFPHSSSLLPEDRGAELLIYDRDDIAHNKTPSARYFIFENQWRLDDPGNGNPVSDDVQIEPGTSVAVRKPRSWFRQWKFIPQHLQTSD